MRQSGLGSAPAAPAKLVVCARLIATLQHGFHTGISSNGRFTFFDLKGRGWDTKDLWGVPYPFWDYICFVKSLGDVPRFIP